MFSIKHKLSEAAADQQEKGKSCHTIGVFLLSKGTFRTHQDELFKARGPEVPADKAVQKADVVVMIVMTP